MSVIKRLAFAFMALLFWAIGTGTALASFDNPSKYEKNEWPFYVANGSTVNSACSGSTGCNLIGSDNKEKAYNFFLGKGFNNNQAAGIVGNLWGESSVVPTAQQDGSSDPFPKDGVGFGIAQWTYKSRQDGLVALAKSENKAVTDLCLQLDYVMKELNEGYQSVVSNLKASTTIEDAVNQWLGPISHLTHQPVPVTSSDPREGGYENAGKPNGQGRVDFANKVIHDYTGNGSGGGSTCSALVNCDSVNAADVSAIRKSVVCTAQAELAKWQTSNHPSYLTYSDQNPQDWCADFVSWVYKTAGTPFKGGLSDGGWRYAYVPFLEHDMPKATPGFTDHTERTYVPKPGDIAIHGDHHTNLVVAVTAGQVTLIGGNQDDNDYTKSVVSKRTTTTWDDTTAYVSPD